MSDILDRDVLDLARPLVKHQIEKIFLCMKVSKVNPVGKVQNRIIVATDYAFYVLKQKFLSKSLSMCRRYSWLSLKLIKEISAESFCLTFEAGKVSVVSNYVRRILSVLVPFAERSVGSKNFELSISHSTEMVTRRGVFMAGKRAAISILDSGGVPDPRILHSITEHPKTFRLTHLAINKILIDALKEDSRVEVIEIDQPLVPDLSSVLQDCLRALPTLNELLFTQPVASASLPSSLVKSCSISKLSFCGFTLNSSTFEWVADFLNHRKIESLVFDGCFEFDQTVNVAKWLSEAPGFKNTRNLSFVNVPKLAIEQIIGLLSEIEELSLDNCGLDIASTLLRLEKKHAPELRLISLSRNDGLMSVSNYPELPDKLTVLELDGVCWKDTALVNITKSVANLAETRIFNRFSLKSARIQIGSWESLFEQLSDIESLRVREFYWDENPVTTSLVDFLSQSTSLRVLSLKGCFRDSGDNEFLYSLQNITTLETLDISSNYFEGDKLLKLLEALKDNRCLEFVKASDSILTDAEVAAFVDCLLTNRRIKSFKIDLESISSPAALLDLMEQLCARGPPLSLIWPKKLDEKNYNDPNMIRAAFVCGLVQKGNLSVVPPPESVEIDRMARPVKRISKAKSTGLLPTGIGLPSPSDSKTGQRLLDSQSFSGLGYVDPSKVNMNLQEYHFIDSGKNTSKGPGAYFAKLG